MTTRTLVLVVLAMLACAGCRRTRCEDLVAAPLAGKYRGGGSLGPDRLLNVALVASTKEVVLTYTALDGSRIRAKYRVTKRSEQR